MISGDTRAVVLLGAQRFDPTLADGPGARVVFGDHRQMTEAAFGHLLHEAVDAVFFAASRDGARHVGAHGLGQREDAGFRNGAHDVALGDHAENGTVVILDDECTDAMARKLARGLLRRGGFAACSSQ